MAKSPDAFRTISEVAEWLGIQAHVLRFWESKFSQVKPIKRAGGRRYYRPNDMLLLGGIKHLLYEDGLTIKGVQKVLREEGMNHVAAKSPPLDELTLSQIEDTPEAVVENPSVQMEPPTAEPRGVVLSFDAPSQEPESPKTADSKAEMPKADTPPTQDVTQPPAQAPMAAPAKPETSHEISADAPPEDSDVSAKPEPETTDLPAEPIADAPTPPVAAPPVGTDANAEGAKQGSDIEADQPGENITEPAEKPSSEDSERALPSFLRRAAPETERMAEDDTTAPVAQDGAAAPLAQDDAATPLAQDGPTPAEKPAPDLQDAEAGSTTASHQTPDAEVTEPTPEPETTPKPRQIPMPVFTAEDKIVASPGLLSTVYGSKGIDRQSAARVATLLERLTAHRDSMSAQRKASNATDSNS